MRIDVEGILQIQAFRVEIMTQLAVRVVSKRENVTI
jgi:hypothetical protein